MGIIIGESKLIEPRDFEKRLTELLNQRRKVRLEDEKRRPSAVLVPIYWQDDRYNIVFTLRTHLVHHHKGEISFPGGAFNPEDGSLQQTALRESFEEIGLHAHDVKVLGELDDILTRGSPFIITPFVGTILPDYAFTLNEFETAEVIRVPIDALLSPGCRRDETEIWADGRVLPAYVYAYREKRIIGATARILTQFLQIYQEAAG